MTSRGFVQAQRPLMDYASYNNDWVSVKILDQYKHQWQWGTGPYYDWCDENCIDKYNIVKYNMETIQGRFKSPRDAMWFSLRWS